MRFVRTAPLTEFFQIELSLNEFFVFARPVIDAFACATLELE